MTFVEAIQSAAARIDERYFRLAIAGRDLPILRERVYCYELYHQLRALPLDFDGLTLTAEPDKSGHPAFKGRRPNPDFVLHTPGEHSHDRTVMEVECRPDLAHIQRDLRKFVLFRSIGYCNCILLIFGRTAVPWERLSTAARDCDFPLDDITVLLHAEAGHAPVLVRRPRELAATPSDAKRRRT